MRSTISSSNSILVQQAEFPRNKKTSLLAATLSGSSEPFPLLSPSPGSPGIMLKKQGMKISKSTTTLNFDSRFEHFLSSSDEESGSTVPSDIVSSNQETTSKSREIRMRVAQDKQRKCPETIFQPASPSRARWLDSETAKPKLPFAATITKSFSPMSPPPIRSAPKRLSLEVG